MDRKKRATIIRVSYLIFCSLLLLTIIVEAQQQLEIVNQQNSATPTTSNNNNPMQLPLQGQIKDHFANCTLATAKPTTVAGKYIFKSCIVAQFSAYISVAPNKFVELNNGMINNDSKCENGTETPKLIVDFPCASLTFDINRTNDSTFVSNIAGIYHFKEGEKINQVIFTNSTPRFATTHSGHYYKCNSEQNVPLGTAGNLILTNFALEAYRDTTGTEFYQIPEECPLDSQPVSDLVRIGVGVCLVALVAIVLIAYFVGRRRWAERSSYESV